MGLAVGGGGVYVVGAFRSAAWPAGPTTLPNAGGTSRRNDTLVARYADQGASGSLDWAQRLGGLGDEQPLAGAGAGGSVYVAGKVTGTVLCGTTTLVAQDTDGFVVKLTEGSGPAPATWAQRLGGSNDATAQAQALGAAGTVYVAGSCSPGAVIAGSVAPPAGGSSHLLRLADAGASGAGAGALHAGGGYDGALALAPTGRLYVGGSFTYTGTFGAIVLPDPSTFQLRTGYLAYVQGTPLAVFPNPAREQAWGAGPLPAGPAELTLFDAVGRPVRTLPVGGPAPVGGRCAWRACPPACAWCSYKPGPTKPTGRCCG